MTSPPARASRELLVLAAAFLLSLPLVTPRIYASDEVQYFSYLRSLWFDHDVSFDNEYRHFYDTGITRYDGFRETFLERETVTKRRESFATVGSAILWSPFYAAADLISRARGLPADGFSTPYVAAVAYASAFYGWLALVLGWWMARRLVGPAGMLAPVIAVWLGTPLLFYMYVAPPMSHATSAFAVAAFLATWVRCATDGRCRAWRRWAGWRRSWPWCASRTRSSRLDRRSTGRGRGGGRRGTRVWRDGG